MPSRADVGLRSNDPVARLIRQAQAELGVDLGLVGRVGPAQHGQQVGQCRDDERDLVAAHRWLRVERYLEGSGTADPWNETQAPASFQAMTCSCAH